MDISSDLALFQLSSTIASANATTTAMALSSFAMPVAGFPLTAGLVTAPPTRNPFTIGVSAIGGPDYITE